MGAFGSLRKRMYKENSWCESYHIYRITDFSGIELLLNNRPLCAVCEDDYEDVLTPNHLTFGRRLETTSDGKPEIHIGKGVGLQERKRFIDTLVDHFWNRWRKEYVTSLREYQRRTNVRHSEKVKMGDTVIIFDDKQPRHIWRMG